MYAFQIVEYSYIFIIVFSKFTVPGLNTYNCTVSCAVVHCQVAFLCHTWKNRGQLCYIIFAILMLSSLIKCKLQVSESAQQKYTDNYDERQTKNMHSICCTTTAVIFYHFVTRGTKVLSTHSISWDFLRNEYFQQMRQRRHVRHS